MFVLIIKRAKLLLLLITKFLIMKLESLKDFQANSLNQIEMGSLFGGKTPLTGVIVGSNEFEGVTTVDVFLYNSMGEQVDEMCGLADSAFGGGSLAIGSSTTF